MAKTKTKKDEANNIFGGAFAALLTSGASDDFSRALMRTSVTLSSDKSETTATESIQARRGTSVSSPEADATARPGFWSGLWRAAEGLPTPGRLETKSAAKPDHEPEMVPRRNLTQGVESALANQSMPNRLDKSNEWTSTSGRPATVGAPTSWRQLIEAAAPLSEVPILMAKLHRPPAQVNSSPAEKEIPTVTVTPETQNEQLDQGLDRPAFAARPKFDPEPEPATVMRAQATEATRQSSVNSIAANRSAGSAKTPAMTAQDSNQASSSKEQTSSALLSTDKPALSQRIEVVSSPRSISAGPIAPNIQQAHSRPTPAPVAAVHPGVVTKDLPAPPRTATLRLDLVDGTSAQANVRERAGSVEVRIVTNNQPLAQRLDNELGLLRRNLDAGGLQLQSADVSYRGQDGGRSGHEREQPTPPRHDKTSSSAVFNLSEAGK